MRHGLQGQLRMMVISSPMGGSSKVVWQGLDMAAALALGRAQGCNEFAMGQLLPAIENSMVSTLNGKDQSGDVGSDFVNLAAGQPGGIDQ